MHTAGKVCSSYLEYLVLLNLGRMTVTSGRNDDENVFFPVWSGQHPVLHTVTGICLKKTNQSLI